MEFKEITVDELKNYLIEKKISFKPYTQEQIDAKKSELGGMPKLLEEYFLKIGWFKDIESSGMGNYIWRLEQLRIMTPQEYFEDAMEGDESYPLNETSNFLEFGGEAVSVDTFAIKETDYDIPNPPLYGWGDSYEHLAEEGYYYCVDEKELPTVKNYFSVIIASINSILSFG